MSQLLPATQLYIGIY